MVKLQKAAQFLAACVLLAHVVPPQSAEAGMMKKGMGGGMGGSGVMELLAAGLLVKFLGEMKTTKGGRGVMGGMTKHVPMPVFVPIQSMMGHGMMMNGGWDMMMMGGD